MTDRRHAPDPELQASLARHGLDGLDRLLGYVPAGDRLEAVQIGALVRLIADAARVGASAP